MASGFRTLAVRRLWPPDLGDGGNSFSGYEDAVDGVVSGHVVDDESEERVSAQGLQQVLGWGSYQTAWTCLHKLRRAIIRRGRERLAGTVEVDESYLGGAEEGVRGRQTEDKALIVVGAEEDGRGIGRIRLRHIPDASSSSLLPFVKDSIEPGSTVHTDGWLGTCRWKLTTTGTGSPILRTTLNRRRTCCRGSIASSHC